jgi:siroheme decarboxylase
MNPLAHQLLNDYQHRFPLVPAPFARLAANTDASEGEILATFAMLQATGYLSRIGPVFRPNTIGASTLAAISVPPADLDRVAGLVSACEGVDHNYERDHAVNLWFVLTAPSVERLNAALHDLEERAGYPLLRLRLVEPYHIDLGFDIDDPARTVKRVALSSGEASIHLSDIDRRLVGVLQNGLPLGARPYAAVAERAGTTEDRVIERIDQWTQNGVIQRFGVIVRHRALGYNANAMAVWNVPDDRVTRLGTALASAPRVTLCYRRTRALPAWPYNLYCMVHGREREEVRTVLAALNRQFDLDLFDQSVLFRTREFKQTGARYVINAEAARAPH